MIARIATEISLNKLFDYEVPSEMEASISVGSRVRVSFNNREVMGYVAELVSQPIEELDVSPLLPGTPKYRQKLKPILKIVGKQSLITPKVKDLALWMATYYCCSIEVALRSLLPEAVRREREGWKKQLFVRYNAEAPEPEKLTQRQQEILAFIQKHGELPLVDLTEQLSCTADTVRRIERTGKISIAPLKVGRDPYANVQILPTKALTLNQEQAVCLKQITEAMDSSDPATRKPFLLFGVTGSGKTEIYLQAITHALQKGQGAIVLVPEISLTPQTVERFKSRFAEKPLRAEVAVLHSHLSDGERHDEWHKIRRGDAKIVIGARSAIFAPVDPLGVIIVDEEHEHSYKQEESPRYNARDVAVVRAQMEETVVVLGSATPSMESYYNTSQGKYTLLKLSKRVDDIQMPQVAIVDMCSEIRVDRGIPLFSTRLKEAIRQQLEESRQVILFLNRRGYATQLQCPDCGYVAECTYCSVSMVYHRRAQLLKCHICGHHIQAPYHCPECRKSNIRHSGAGTERVEETLQKLFPQARIRRMDSDTLKKKEDYRNILNAFGAGKIDILLGTQIITKGLHFPRVTLVGILNADISLHRPDFRASERTFQLITQVAGRAGRGTDEGEVIVQTFTPWAPAILYAKHHDYESFYADEIVSRKELHYPPSSRLALLTIRSMDEEKLQLTAQHIREQLDGESFESIRPLVINGPVPALLERSMGYYRYHILLRTVRMMPLSRKLFELFQSVKCPKGVSFTVDIDPLDLT